MMLHGFDRPSKRPGDGSEKGGGPFPGARSCFWGHPPWLAGKPRAPRPGSCRATHTATPGRLGSRELPALALWPFAAKHMTWDCQAQPPLATSLAIVWG
eukprot:6478376-Amphidinium_carterae.1